MAKMEQGGRPTKAERKEQARAERELLQRKQQARYRNRLIGMVVVVLVLVGGTILVVTLTRTSETPPSVSTDLPDPSSLPGIMHSPPPWPNNTDQLSARLARLDLPPLNDTVPPLHHHVQLYIFVDGKPVIVPANIGLSDQAASPLHTHTPAGTGLVHVESADPNFRPVLGQFMDVWGPYFTSTCLGNECNEGDRQLRVFVGGRQYVGDPTLLPLTDLSTIVLTFGTPSELPNPIPSTFPSAG
jgi:hypothetical protein